ncbi:SDR family NAD(P)-dependent oxidoreductase [Micromonospora sp. NPDC049523]|uniref:SDR family NAD(P)-dependent oxidoreductase n=1 Tax=Micromonospora sp. NPDC049523 TaxID=3155921 RepID=UPI003421647F
MSKVIAVFGAGTGLGVAVARRFGREGYRVALVARRRERLDTLVEQLATEGIEAAAFPADLTDTTAVPALIAAIRARFGRIDVIEYAPIGVTGFTPAAELDGEKLTSLVHLYLLTPVEVIRAVLPEMTERGDGAILVGHGLSAARPMPYLSGVGPVMAATRNYLYSLHGELADQGVYVGTLAVSALITGSEAHQAFASGNVAMPDGMEPPLVSPDDLADRYWEMYGKRDRVEQIHPPIDAAPAA